MHYYRASTASKSKSLAFLILILLLASPLLLHHSSASSQQEDNQDWYDDWSQDPYANCISFPCPVPEYPPDNDCTLITAINPITNTTETSTYMITHNLPEDSTQEACLKVVPYGRPDREGCNSIGCHRGDVFSTLVLCLYNQESPCGIVFKRAPLGTAEKEAKAKALVEVVVENHDVSEVVL
ncbi:hypothetical protein BGZ89_001065 [Linnemannia elongata]|nr:hypothetical protein BGZ89_001065 [Linnemannia elongata]